MHVIFICNADDAQCENDLTRKCYVVNGKLSHLYQRYIHTQRTKQRTKIAESIMYGELRVEMFMSYPSVYIVG